MGTKATFKIYNDGKFVIGSWIKYDGGVSETSVFPNFLKNLKYDLDKKSFYDYINKFVNDGKFGSMFGDKKKPFINQINDEGMTSPDVLFWDTSMSDKKLMENYIWGEYTYEVRFTKKVINIKINYNGAEKVFYMKRDFGTGSIIGTINEVQDWVDDIEYGLNDCDCKEH
jgi:hypothetical protein